MDLHVLHVKWSKIFCFVKGLPTSGTCCLSTCSNCTNRVSVFDTDCDSGTLCCCVSPTTSTIPVHMWTSAPVCLSHHCVLNPVQSATVLGSETRATDIWIQIQHNFIRSRYDWTPKQPCLHLHLYPLALSHLHLLSSIHQFSSSKCCHLSTGIWYSAIVILYFCSVVSHHIAVFDFVHILAKVVLD